MGIVGSCRKVLLRFCKGEIAMPLAEDLQNYRERLERLRGYL